MFQLQRSIAFKRWSEEDNSKYIFGKAVSIGDVLCSKCRVLLYSKDAQIQSSMDRIYELLSLSSISSGCTEDSTFSMNLVKICSEKKAR